MFIKIKELDGKEAFLNSRYIQKITPLNVSTDEGCNILIEGEEFPLKVSNGFRQLEFLLDVVSTEKTIEELKLENMKIEQQMKFDKYFSEIYGRRKT